MTKDATKEIPEYIQIRPGEGDRLIIGQTYYISNYYNGNQHFEPITITGKARPGTYGERVTCSDGTNRYAGPRYIGRSRSDNYWSRVITYKKNPAFQPAPKTYVQLSLFDF